MSFESDYDNCEISSTCISLPFDRASIEEVILKLSDNFNFRVILSDARAKTAAMVTTGLTLTGGMIGHHYAGRVGAVFGGAIGGVCGLGIIVVSMRSIWNDIKDKLCELFEIVYDYLACLGLDDYRKAVTYLTQTGNKTELALLIVETASAILGKKILSTLDRGIVDMAVIVDKY